MREQDIINCNGCDNCDIEYCMYCNGSRKMHSVNKQRAYDAVVIESGVDIDS